MIVKRLDGPIAASQVHRGSTLRESMRLGEKGQQLQHDEARSRWAAVCLVKELMLSLEGTGRHRWMCPHLERTFACTASSSEHPDVMNTGVELPRTQTWGKHV